MRKIEKFEDLIAWQKARVLTRLVLSVTSTGPLAREFGMRDQIRLAARSIMANIAEGFERSGSKEFHKGLSIACGSCAEVRSDLYTLFDAQLITQSQFEELSQAALETSRVTNALRSSVRRRIAQK